MRVIFIIIYSLFFSILLSFSLAAQQDSFHDHEQSGQEEHHHDGSDESHDAASHTHESHSHESGSDNHGTGEGHGTSSCGFHHDEHLEFDPGGTAFHHISDQNIYSIGPWHFPLPCIFYVPGEGLNIFSSAKFHADGHGNGSYAYDGYVLYLGSAKRIRDANFPNGLVDIGKHNIFTAEEEVNGKAKEVIYLCHNDTRYECEPKSTLDGGLFGGGLTSFHDISVTKNVFSMLLVVALLSWLFMSLARAYKRRRGKAPAGAQSFMEPMFLFIQEDVAKPFLGDKWEKFQPFLMALFFFILAFNLFGLIPFFGAVNVTGNLNVTLVLAVLAFIVTNINGKKHYWQHIFNMPGIPLFIKFIMTPVEFLGLFIKPITLMFRLFGNIVAGHMVVVVFVGLIFVFGQNGANAGAAYGTAAGSILLTMFMMAIELLVAFIQAFVFTILTASYIGAAIEEHHEH